MVVSKLVESPCHHGERGEKSGEDQSVIDHLVSLKINENYLHYSLDTKLHCVRIVL